MESYVPTGASNKPQSDPLPAIIERAAYFDQIRIHASIRVTTRQKNALKADCHAVKVTRLKQRRDDRFVCRIILFRPGPRALAVLKMIEDSCPSEPATREGKAVLKRLFRIVYVEPAAEFVTASRHAAMVLGGWAKRHLSVRNHGEHWAVVYASTMYWAHRNARTCVPVIYDDRPSKKHPGRPCARIEFRAYSSRVVRRCGIVHVDDLIGFDFVKFFKDHLRFQQITLPGLADEVTAAGVMGLGKRILHRSRAKRPWMRPGYFPGNPAFDQFLKAGRLALRLAATSVTTSGRCSDSLGREFTPVQGIRDVLRRAGAPTWRAVRAVDGSAFGLEHPAPSPP